MKGILSTILAIMSLHFGSWAMEQNWQGSDRDIGTINFQFTQIEGDEVVKRAIPISLPAIGGEQIIYTNHNDMRKTLLAIEMGNAIKEALVSFEKSNKKSGEHREFEETLSIEKNKESGEYKKIGEKLLAETLSIEERLGMLKITMQFEEKFFETIKLMKTLAHNISEYKPQEFFCPTMVEGSSMRGECAMLCASLSVTTGGAKDIGHFRKVVEGNKVPETSDFPMEGFLSEFALSIEGLGGTEYLAVHPTTAFDAQTNKLYVQLGMSTNVTPEDFKRKPLNLCFVIDISGSMNAKDGTEKNRLGWAKAIMDMAVVKMTAADMISIVVFDDKVETILKPTPVNNEAKEGIQNSYASLKPRGSTDVYIGLKQGFEQVLLNKNSKYENRVILLSDAGHNTGSGTTNTLFKLIEDNASDKNPIGFTAIGMGDNFEEKLIHSISMSKGGNYLFVQSGMEMLNFFGQFNYLVSPVAYNFKANVMLNRDFQAKLVKAYGIPMKDDEFLGDVIDVRTLFFTSAGGGAMVLEYQLEK